MCTNNENSICHIWNCAQTSLEKWSTKWNKPPWQHNILSIFLFFARKRTCCTKIPLQNINNFYAILLVIITYDFIARTLPTLASEKPFTTICSLFWERIIKLFLTDVSRTLQIPQYCYYYFFFLHILATFIWKARNFYLLKLLFPYMQ